jgi:hypothetical protein
MTDDHGRLRWTTVSTPETRRKGEMLAVDGGIELLKHNTVRSVSSV